jgi:archaellum component FlaD/FlaE
LEEDTEVRKQVTLYSTERQRRQTEQRAAAAAAASVSAASATTPEKDDDIADDDDADDADAILVPDGELLEYDSEVETEDEDEDEDTATQGLNAVLDGVSLPARPTPVGDEDL